MGPAPISTAFLLASLVAVGLLELADSLVAPWLQSPYSWLLVKRTLQSLVILALAKFQAGGVHVFGLDTKHLLSGLKKGMLWSAAFGAAAGLACLLLIVFGQQPLAMIRSPLPGEASQRFLFFLVGGIAAPVAEEFVFRGLVFGYLRRWSLPAAILISTALFAAFHLPTIPVTQVVGGLVFAVAYHTSKSLMTPIVIHILGNLAIFTLSLPWIR